MTPTIREWPVAERPRERLLRLRADALATPELLAIVLGSGGAGGSAQAAFGAKTGDLLTTITIGCFVAFLGLAIGLTFAIRDDVAPRAATPTPPVPATTTTSNPADVATDTPDQETTAPANSPGEHDAAAGQSPVESAGDQPQTTEPQATKPDTQP